MTEEEFWKSTFREIMAMIRVHNELNKGKKDNGVPTGFIDEVF